MKPLPHIMISASAGSGKTYQLVLRYLHLLSLGIEPESIAAMTFTRKAAGEFFHRILRRLSELAAGECDAAEYFRDIEPRPAQPPDFNRLLRRMVRRMHRLRLGTLDSFFATITACFPLELGLPPGAAVMAEDEASRAREEALERLLERASRGDGGEDAKTLLEGYKLGTFGREDKSVLRSLDEWIRDGHRLWLESGGSAKWGDLNAIWPRDARPQPIVWRKQQPLADIAAGVRRIADGKQWKDEAIEKWHTLAGQVLSFTPGQPIPAPLKDVIGKCGEAWDDLHKGGGEFFWQRKKTSFTGPDAQALVAMVETLAAMEFLNRCERTRGIANVIAAYEARYQEAVRQQGRLSFDDVTRLLSEAANTNDEHLWLRLDGRYDHWLFDEFQDTSVLQWQVAGRLVDEVLQDTSGRRSFFAVGDIKQSIYLWRQAEPGLLQAVESRYARGRDGIQKRSLADSRRSCQEVLYLVNRIFGDRAALEAMLPGCLEHWKFEDHRSAKPELHGHAALLWPEADPGHDDDPRHALVAALIREIDPIRRGLSCAVLVRGNNTAAELADYLRSATDGDVICESEQVPATDNPVTLALLAVLRLAAHPGDGFAREQVRMTPLARIFDGEFGGSEFRLAAETLADIRDNGFAGLVEKWAARIESDPEMDLDVFSQHRLDQLLELAVEFDETGDRDVDAFLDFAQESGRRPQDTPDAVQVMTIHKSKGLEFDVVILPDLDGASMTATRGLGLMKRQRLFSPPDWVLQAPPGSLAGFDPTLAAAKSDRERREGFESLCQLYVAMTRAESGLYLITKRPPKSDDSAMSEARLLRERLAEGDPVARPIGGVTAEVVSEFGLAAWHEKWPRTPIESPLSNEREKPGQLAVLLRKSQPLHRRVSPSDEESFQITGAALFATGRESGRRFGSLLHALLAEIEWHTGGSEAAVEQRWTELGFGTDPAAPEAFRSAMLLLTHPATRPLFDQPKAPAVVWRERSFDIHEDGEWISGIMDRVVIERTDHGGAKSAWLIDFKTDELPGEKEIEQKADGYRPQMNRYRQALARLLSLPQPSIRASLVFVRMMRVVEV